MSQAQIDAILRGMDDLKVSVTELRTTVKIYTKIATLAMMALGSVSLTIFVWWLNRQ